ncbi:MAG: bifunctional diaminohydroxyphosphoribosylaminopyrimidine deaminase/5-amino-6-(5-phosphoribosylamino)uracil reductase RibD [Desulfovibrio sp.]
MSTWKEIFPTNGLCGGEDNHDFFMAQAVGIARNGRGRTAPNPCVGAVLVKDGAIVAQGWHTAYGQLHAERECIADAKNKGIDTVGATMYVTLEPCNHHGKTPPCTEGILEAGITKVVVGCEDPNPDVSGGGIAFLKEKGVEVITGVNEQSCKDLIEDFLIWKTTERTANILKMATTLDGKIAARGGRAEAVSCPESFAGVHKLRAQVHAVIVGGNTFYGDNPSLTCRMDDLPEDFEQPYAVIVTSRLPKAFSGFKLLKHRPEKTIFWTTEFAAQSPLADTLRERGTHVWGMPTDLDAFKFEEGFRRLRDELNCYITLCEGGGHLATSMLEQGMVDEFVMYLTPRVLGDEEGKSVFAGREVRSMNETLDMRLCCALPSGQDMRLVYRPKRND